MLIQRKWWEIREFDIRTDGLFMRRRLGGRTTAETVPFEAITGEVLHWKVVKKKWLYAGIIFLLLGAGVWVSRLVLHDVQPSAELIWGVPGVLCLLWYALTMRDYRYIVCSNNRAIIFLENNPSEQALESFIVGLMKRRDAYLRDKYAVVDPALPVDEQLYRLKWLLDHDVIHAQEYDRKKQQLTTAQRGSGISVMD